MARTGGRRPRRAVAEEDEVENGIHEVESGQYVVEEDKEEVEEVYEEVDEDRHVSNTVKEEPALSAAPDQNDDVNYVAPVDEEGTKNEEVERHKSVLDTVNDEPSPYAAPDKKDDVNYVSPMDEEVAKKEEEEGDNPVPDTGEEERSPSVAPGKKDDVNYVAPMDEDASKNEEVEGDNPLPDTVEEEPSPTAAPDEKNDVSDVVPMDEEAAKNDKKRGREKELEVEVEKTSKAAKTEEAAVEDVENSPRARAAKVEDGTEGEPENGDGDGVEMVEGAVIGDDEPGKTKRLKKRKIAMIIAYCGANYQGMQRNPGAITIEGELEQALYRAGAITKDNFGVPRKVDWMRAARTDKGVSAVGQIVSGQFIIEPEGFVERVNSFLPRDIVILGYKRVTASFNSKKLCDKRRYEYVIPTYCFDPSIHLNRDTANALRAEGKEESVESDAKEVKDGADIVDGQKGAPAEAREEKIYGETGLPSKVNEEPADGETGPPSKVNEELVAGESVVQSKVKEEPVNGGTVIHSENKEDVKPVDGETAGSGKVKEEHADGDTVDPMKVKEESVNGDTVVSTTGKEVRPVDGGIPIPTDVKKECPYEFDEAELNRLNRILARYKGTHNYHNFTARTQAEDPSAHRFIISFEAEDIVTVDGIEFVRLHVVGQSFMLHQIRKMVGLVVAIMRGAAPESVMDFALRKDTKFNVPMAPELGLFLVECYYSSYNKKFKSSHEELSLKDYKDAVSGFKKNVIYPHIAGTEAKDKVFPMWLHGINDRHYPDFVAAREGTYKPGNRTPGNAA